jgi:hypothetical protein
LNTPGKRGVWDEEAGVEIGAVRCIRVELAVSIRPAQESITVAPGRIAPKHHHISVPRRPLALHAKETRTDVEDHVVPTARANGPVDVEAERESSTGDLCLRE